MALPFDFPSGIWKRLVHEQLSAEDLDHVDDGAASLVNELLYIHKTAIDSNGATTIMNDLNWVIALGDRMSMPLISTSRNSITVGEIPEFLSILLNTRLLEADHALRAMRRG